MSENLVKINETLPILQFDKEGLSKWVKQLVSKYSGITVREEDIADIKAVMADLNKAHKSIEDARKEAVRRVSAPIKTFEVDVKEIASLILETRANLDSQVKNFEAKEREAKRVEVQSIIDKACTPYQNFTIPMQDKWLNKSTSIKSVREDIVKILNEHEVRLSQEALAETARQDRITAIQSQVEALNSKFEMSWPLALFLSAANTDPTTPLSEVQELINNTFQMEAEKRQAQQAKAQEQANVKHGFAVSATHTAPDPAIDPFTEPVEVLPEPSITQPTMQTWQITITIPVDQVDELKTRLQVVKALAVANGYKAARIA